MFAQRGSVGVDLGTTRIRVAFAKPFDAGKRIIAISARTLPPGCIVDGVVMDPEHVGMILAQALDDVGAAGAEASISVAPPHANVRAVEFPKMSALERERAAYFESVRKLGSQRPLSCTLAPIDKRAGRFVLGAVYADVLSSRLFTLKCAGLPAARVDYEPLVFVRMYDFVDAVIDVGAAKTALYGTQAALPIAIHAPTGGNAVTDGIARDLALGQDVAERRKRLLGTAGAGEVAKTSLARVIANLIEAARSYDMQIERIALVGNGARLVGLSHTIQSAANVCVDERIPMGLLEAPYPDDVLRRARNDWMLCAGLALGSAA